MQLGNNLDYDLHEAQNIVIGKVAALPTNVKDGLLVYLTATGSQGLYLRKEGNWIHLGQIEALANGAIQITPVSGVQYLSVRVDGDTIFINGAGNLQVGANSIGNEELDNANIRIGDFAAPNANFSMAGYKITNLGTPTANTDAANKEYVDLEIAQKIAAMGDFVGDWEGPGYPTVGSGAGGAIKKGDWYRITAVVTIGDKTLEIGDALFSKANAPGTTDANWFVLQSNVGEATSTALGLTRVSTGTDLTTAAGANTTRVVRIADLLLRTATESRTGLIELATQAEVNTGTDAVRAVTPATMAVYVNARIGARGFAADIGDGTATVIVITHNFATYDIIDRIYRNAGSRDTIIVDVERTSVNSVTIKFGTAPAVGAFRILLQKVA